MAPNDIQIREATLDDLSQLDQLEQQAFATDRLSQRRLRHWILASNRVMLVAMKDQQLLGYALTLLHRGTRLARLYSIAIDQQARGLGLGRTLMQASEAGAARRGRIFLRLEVAKNNQAAIGLYQSMGYVIFGTYSDYYDDHQDALRMQKRIRHVDMSLVEHDYPWYRQTTEFTCGPSALMMAMSALDRSIIPNQLLELDIWRQATTIFMTSGHGGCHPVGLALAAQDRGFDAEVFLNKSGPLFIEGVRSQKKKDIMMVVDGQFFKHADDQQIPIHYTEVTQAMIDQWLAEEASVLILVSTYRMDRKKTPHWVIVTASDEYCFYVHDPAPEGDQQPMDCQHLPIAREDFSKMSAFGKERLRTAVVIRKKPQTTSARKKAQSRSQSE